MAMASHLKAATAGAISAFMPPSAAPIILKPCVSPPNRIPRLAMAYRVNSSGPKMLAIIMVTAPPTVASAIIPAATLAIVPASSGLALIHSPTPRVIVVMFCTSSRRGPSLVSVMLMPTSSHALRRLLRSPPRLSTITRAISAFSPALVCSAFISASKSPSVIPLTSSVMPEPASAPKMAESRARRSTLPRSRVALLMSRRMSGISRILPLASETSRPSCSMASRPSFAGLVKRLAMARMAVPAMLP